MQGIDCGGHGETPRVLFIVFVRARQALSMLAEGKTFVWKSDSHITNYGRKPDKK